jgi:hypothetical protein
MIFLREAASQEWVRLLTVCLSKERSRNPFNLSLSVEGTPEEAGLSS